jgi:hypothetical protein
MNDVIAARRQAIQDAAPCEGCGTTLAACKANRGKDPTAPPWFGCCARGLGLNVPCNHVPNASALLALLAEIESGVVRTVEEAAPKPVKQGIEWDRYLDQGEQWMPDGKPMVAIADMDPEWRYNASRFLERRAAVFASKYSTCEALRLVAELASPIGPSETVADQLEADAYHAAAARRRDPVAWIRTTVLYRALVADLPDCPTALEAIAARAKHWSTCPARTGDGDCRCEAIAAQCQRCRDGGTCRICGGNGCGSCPDCSPQVPEWSL